MVFIWFDSILRRNFKSLKILIMCKNNYALTLFSKKNGETVPTQTIIGSESETMNALLVNSPPITSSKESENGEYYYSGINLTGFITKISSKCTANSGGGVILPKVQPNFEGLERTKND